MLATNEELRLAELQKYGILFTSPEPAFDRITELAKRLFNVPIVLISFVDRDLQWFKSCIGFPVAETAREISFCTHALGSDDAMVICDASADPRFCDNPLVMNDPGIRFYAGAPMANSGGFRLGTVCVMDTKPRPHGITSDEKKTLADLASIVVSELELRLAIQTKLETIDELKETKLELEEINDLLQKATTELHRSNDDLARFAQVCSHDLQAPARTTNQFLQLLVRRAGGQLNEEAREYVQIALDNSRTMVQRVTDILTYSKAANRQEISELELVDAGEICREVTATLQGVIRETEASVTCCDLPAVRFNRQALLQVFQNLIGNALHYRGAAKPRIHVSCRQMNGEEVICFEDNGIGINEAYFKLIFEPFKRLHGQDKEGSGVGLSICRVIAERAGGRIWVESKLGEGSKFFFAIPRHAAEGASA